MLAYQTRPEASLRWALPLSRPKTACDLLLHEWHHSHISQTRSQRSCTSQKNLMACYELCQMREMAWFLGIQVLRDCPSRKLWLLQDSYINKITNCFHLAHDESSPKSHLFIPLTINNLQPYDGQSTPAKRHEYMRKIGSLLYTIIITQSDAAKAINKLAEFAINPGPKHLEAVNHAIVYLYSTHYYVLEYSAKCASEEVFLCTSNAVYGDLIRQKSSEDYLCKLFDTVIDWRASKQCTVTISTTETELLAISEAGKSVLWWKHLFFTIDFDSEHDLFIKCDNAQTIDLLSKEDPQLCTKLRHVDIHHHWLHQKVQIKQIAVDWTLPVCQSMILPNLFQLNTTLTSPTHLD